MELALDIIGERFTTLYQMSKPTYLSRDVFAPLEIGILTYIKTHSDSNFRNQNVPEGAIFFFWNQYSNIVRKKLSN